MFTNNIMKRFNRSSLILLLLFTVSGCTVMKVMNVGDDIPRGILNSDDLETVKVGLPTYLLTLDGLLITYPENESLLLSASSLNSAYSGVFVEDFNRAQNMAKKALNLALRAICVHNQDACDLNQMEFNQFEQVITKMNNKNNDITALYVLSTAWAGHIQLNATDWNAVADLAKVSLLMEHIAEIDMNYENGMVPLYLGVLNSILPEALGGKPGVAKAYFEQAIAMSQGKNLIIKVLYAQKYARLVFDRPLHDQLLEEVLQADPHVDGLTLRNVFAQKEAQRLLQDSDEYF